MPKSSNIKSNLFLWGTLASVFVLLAAPSIAEEAVNDTAKRGKIEAMYEEYKKSFPEVEDLSAEQVVRLADRAQTIFVDVRNPKEQAVSMLPGAITADEFQRDIESYKDHTVIGYCTIGSRSGKLARKLQEKGVRMINLRGGILAWLHAGGKVYKDGKLTTRVHIYGKKWHLAPSDYESVW